MQNTSANVYNRHPTNQPNSTNNILNTINDSIRSTPSQKNQKANREYHSVHYPPARNIPISFGPSEKSTTYQNLENRESGLPCDVCQPNGQTRSPKRSSPVKRQNQATNTYKGECQIAQNRRNSNNSIKKKNLWRDREVTATTTKDPMSIKTSNEVAGLSGDVFHQKEKMERYKREKFECTRRLKEENGQLWRENACLKELDQSKSRDYVILKQEHGKVLIQLEDTKNEMFRRERGAIHKDTEADEIIYNLESKVIEFKGQFTALEEINKSMDHDLKNWEVKAQKVLRERDYYRRKMDNLEIEKNEFANQRDFYIGKSENLEKDKLEVEQQIKELNRKFGSSEADRHELETQKGRLGRKEVSLESDKLDLEKHLGFYKGKYEAIENEKLEQINQHDLLQKDLNKLKNENRMYIENQDNENHELQQNLKQIVSNFDFEQKDFHRKIEILEAQKRELETELLANLRKYDTDQIDNRRQIEQLKNENRDLCKDVENLMKDCKNYLEETKRIPIILNENNTISTEQVNLKKAKDASTTESIQKIETLEREKLDAESMCQLLKQELDTGKLVMDETQEDWNKSYNVMKKMWEDDRVRAEELRCQLESFGVEKNQIQKAYEHMGQTVRDYERVFSAQRSELCELRNEVRVGDDRVSAGNQDLLRTAAEDYENVLSKLRELEEYCEVLKNDNLRLNEEVAEMMQV